MDGDKNTGRKLRKRKGEDVQEDRNFEEESSNQSEGETTISGSGEATSECTEIAPTTVQFMSMMVQVLKESQESRELAERDRERKEEERRDRAKREEEDRYRREEERRIEREDERRKREKQEDERKAKEEMKKSQAAEEYHRQQLEFMMTMKEEEAKRQREHLDEQRRWKEQHEKEKAKESRISGALRSFPKIGSTTLLPAQLNNYQKLLEGLEASPATLITRLPEVLTGAAATTFQNMARGEYTSFADLKSKFLAAAGITFSSAGRSFMKPDIEALKKLSAVDLWCHLKGMAQRLIAGASDLDGVVSALCVVFLNVFGSNNLVLSLAGCSQFVEVEVSSAVFKTFEAFGAVLGHGSGVEHGKRNNRSDTKKCDNCGRGGHKSADCWSKPKTKAVTCFICSREGHISTNCPDKITSNNSTSSTVNKTVGQDAKKGWKKNSVVREPSEERVVEEDCTMSVSIGGLSLKVLPDSGAQITVIPPRYVSEHEYTGDSTCLVDFEGRGDRRRKIAMVDITIGNKVFKERVAVSDHLGETGLLSLPIIDEAKSSCILEEFYRQRKNSVRAVQTRAGKKLLDEESRRDEAVMAEEAAVLRAVPDEPSSREELVCQDSSSPEELVTKDSSSPEELVIQDSSSMEELVTQDSSSREELVTQDSSSMEELVTQDSSSRVELVSKEVRVKLAEGSNKTLLEKGEVPEADLLDCLKGGSDKEELREQVKLDSTLTVCKRLASQKERGYYWEDGILMHKMLNELGEVVQRVVVPKEKRSLICRLAHDKMGHLGHRKLRQMLNIRFTWPKIGQDLELYVASCTACQLAGKRGQRKVPLIERPVLSEPFEAMAIDLVGPFPMAKGRFRYLLTAICLATRWPDVIPLKSVTAKAVAEGLVHIFGRCGLPYVILADNGSQFSGRLMSELSSTLGIEVKHSSPYHPEGNGLIERMHSTLVSMIRKAIDHDLDWAGQVPFALFALRQMPCRSTGLSPYELVWGKGMRTPLDILYRGWKENIGENLNVSEWTEKLLDRIEVLRDHAVCSANDESEKRKLLYDRGKSDRVYVVGSKVLVRMAGRHGKLEDSWEGPFEVVKVLSAVNYKVKLVGGKRLRNVHVNLLKSYVDRKKIRGVTVLAEEAQEDVQSGARLSGKVNIDVLKEVKVVLEDFPDLLDGEPGVYKGKAMSLEVVEGAVPVTTKPYRIPDAIKPKVKEALDGLIARGWVVEASTPWVSPIVPVAKPDGSVRICVNYKKLNEVTHQRQFPIPHFEDVLGEVGQAVVLSKMDLMKGYHQVPLDEQSQQLTGFVTPWGCFQYTVLPFGLKNAPALFQQLMTKVLEGCRNFSLVYIDDVLVFSQRECEHEGHVRSVLEAVRESGLKLNPKKCEWARSRVEFLGHIVGEGRVSVPEARVKALRDFRKPVSRHDMRAALGTFGYYRKFVKNYAELTFPLTPSTSTKAPGRVKWTPEMDSAFVSLCNTLCDVCCLFVPVDGDAFSLHTDASGRGVGAVLYVVRRGDELPVAFYSRQLRGAETRYSATELEALAVVASIEHFVPYLYGRRFEMVTDHAPLCALMSSQTLNRRLRGFMLRLLEFDVHISYRPGSMNGDADGLSRQAWVCHEELFTSAVNVPGAESGNPKLSRGDVGTPTNLSSYAQKNIHELLGRIMGCELLDITVGCGCLMN